MKSPFKSKRVYGMVGALATIAWKLLPLEWQQPFVEARAYVVGRLTPSEIALLVSLGWWAYGMVVADGRINWAFWRKQ